MSSTSSDSGYWVDEWPISLDTGEEYDGKNILALQNLLAQATRIQASLFNFIDSNNFADTWVLFRTFQFMPKELPLAFAPTHSAHRSLSGSATPYDAVVPYYASATGLTCTTRAAAGSARPWPRSGPCSWAVSLVLAPVVADSTEVSDLADFSRSDVVPGTFLTWHHYFWAYEEKLRTKCGYNGSLPYWEWGLDVKNPAALPAFDGSNMSLGGNGGFNAQRSLLSCTMMGSIW
ncbi:hypothetical protein B0T25DRAFT_584480 [Lasiosphaeria hispida]|uniref:Tyrosinase copper-binding domain-containing protein n=1 Tax=Lasiosphaeria hispida TaxID=260671 RepID=A0AAJ0M926_9PEZI|nr:hypothetical protein B0T25DRAFT_584480 [Lasiosphaeria hispida]